MSLYVTFSKEEVDPQWTIIRFDGLENYLMDYHKNRRQDGLYVKSQYIPHANVHC